MQTKRILAFLTKLTANNNRSWFLEHKKEYSECRVDFEAGIAEANHSIYNRLLLNIL